VQLTKRKRGRLLLWVEVQATLELMGTCGTYRTYGLSVSQTSSCTPFAQVQKTYAAKGSRRQAMAIEREFAVSHFLAQGLISDFDGGLLYPIVYFSFFKKKYG
jgi:hypothetical protein